MSELDKKINLDIRLRRARSFTSLILHEIRDLLPCEADERKIHDRILHMFYINGYAWTNDEERQRMGFEPRDKFGWTKTEKQKQHQAEQERMLAMCNLPNNPVPVPLQAEILKDFGVTSDESPEFNVEGSRVPI